MFSVVYKNKATGKRETLELDVKERQDVWPILKERGITAISITESKKRISSSSTGFGKARIKVAAIICLALVATLLVVVFMQKTQQQEAPKVPQKKVKQIRDVAAPVIKPREPKPVTVEKDSPREIPYWEKDETNGLSRTQLMKWKIHHRPPAAYTNNTSQTEAQPAYAIFNTHCENEIACLLTIEPGSTLVGDPGYERWFVREFLKSLETPIEITKDDTPEQVQLKQDMIDVRKQLKARYDAGEDLAEVMRKTREEYQELARYKEEIKGIFWESVNQADITTEASVDLYLEAANKMLESKGIAPMELGPIAKRRLLRKLQTMSGGR